MPNADYVFVDRWSVDGDLNEVADIIEDVERLTEWRPSVYLSFKRIKDGGDHGLGGIVRFRAKGFLPYTLTIDFQTVESRYPHGFTLEAKGDLEGTGIWTFEQNGKNVDVTYEWRVRANKPVVNKLSFLLKPIFAANHTWTMARGEEGLKLELMRRHALTDEERSKVPAPRGPLFPHNLKWFR